MKNICDKQLLVGADFAGYPLKEKACAHLRADGHTYAETAPKAFRVQEGVKLSLSQSLEIPSLTIQRSRRHEHAAE